jgi:hypothetical protein
MGVTYPDPIASGGTGTGWAGEVANFAALPAVAGASGDTYLVLADQGTWLLGTLKRAGLYYSDGVTWEKKGDFTIKYHDNLSITISGTDTYTGSALSTITSYTSGEAFMCIFTNANTGASTINIDSVGAKAIQKNGSTALASGDILAGQPYWLLYDGTDFQIIGSLGGSSTTTRTIDWDLETVITSGSAVSGFLAATNGYNELEIQGSGGGVSKIAYLSLVVPEDYISGGDLKIDSWTTDFTNLTTWTATVNINGTVDATINAVSITPTADTTYQTTTNTLGSAISAGDVLQLRLNFTGSNGDDVRTRRLTLDYTGN